MPFSSIGDLAQTFVTRRANTRLTSELSKLGTELTTGLKRDKGTALSGDLGILTALERSVTELAALSSAAKEAKVFADATEARLGRIQDLVQDLGTKAVLSQGGVGGNVESAVIAAAQDAFATTVSSMNATGAGRFLFSGTATGTAPLRDADAILADLASFVAGAPDAASFNAAVDAYFGPGGGFETTDYQGTAQDLAPQRISQDESVDLGLRADSALFRDTLAGIARIALLDGGAFVGAPAERQAIIDTAIGGLRGADNGLTRERSVVGSAQGLIDRAITRNASETTALDQTRISLIGADPYETATRIEQTQVQLESLYTLTARLSRLNLANFL
ncbi:flagellar hook-associated protein 3 FlgL [Palleronia salina]|uniref:Flagellin n=1 Tax=Palleronia salina TaxID=313368 RepID=A0A1M6D4U3_9RHOB|nr:flagellin [Palleronia salina]SHI68250.1 flagellar hook-associated protein 3 FlgL [Palleronia salina]